jgi:hypothetical protein
MKGEAVLRRRLDVAIRRCEMVAARIQGPKNLQGGTLERAHGEWREAWDALVLFDTTISKLLNSSREQHGE